MPWYTPLVVSAVLLLVAWCYRWRQRRSAPPEDPWDDAFRIFPHDDDLWHDESERRDPVADRYGFLEFAFGNASP